MKQFWNCFQIASGLSLRLPDLPNLKSMLLEPYFNNKVMSIRYYFLNVLNITLYLTVYTQSENDSNENIALSKKEFLRFKYVIFLWESIPAIVISLYSLEVFDICFLGAKCFPLLYSIKTYWFSVLYKMYRSSQMNQDTNF